MPSADVDRAARAAVDARVINNGQSCIAAKRFIVDARIYAEFEARFVSGMRGLLVGDPMEETTQVGPLATADILEDLDRQVRRSVEVGARLLTGGTGWMAPAITTRRPCWRMCPPTRRQAARSFSARWRRSSEWTGWRKRSRWRTTTEFGLGASVWTNDAGRAGAVDRGH